jgi:hypothetical protein
MAFALNVGRRARLANTAFTLVGSEADLTASFRSCVIIVVGFLMHNALRTHKLSTLTTG